MTAYWSVPREWEGETAFLIAGGPSLRGFDASCLRGRRVVAVNRSYELAPFADVLWHSDGYFPDMLRDDGRPYRQALERLPGIRATLGPPNASLPGWKFLRNAGEFGLCVEPDGVKTGRNSGYAAINLAEHFGVKRIVLLGYDMKRGPEGEVHWHSGYRWQDGRDHPTSPDVMERNMLPHFVHLVEPLKELGVEVVNATPGSALSLWPFRPLEEVLRWT